jgi:hypothetical protein
MRDIDFNVVGERRKLLVRAMSEILGEDAVYQGAPSFSYTVDGYTISRNGVVSCPDSVTSEEVHQLIAALQARGFSPIHTESKAAMFTVEMPRDGFSEDAYGRLQKIIASKAALLKKAIGTETLEIEMSQEKLFFPWFTLHDLEGEADAYTKLIAALYNMAKTQKRVVARARETPNEKFAMRLLLVRLGFIGDKYKAARKFLLRNLTGNSSWKDGHPPKH